MTAAKFAECMLQGDQDTSQPACLPQLTAPYGSQMAGEVVADVTVGYMLQRALAGGAIMCRFAAVRASASVIGHALAS